MADEMPDLDAIRTHLATLLGGWWHADVDNQATAAALDAVIDSVPALLTELAGTRQLFDLQWTRMTEASGRWRAEDPTGRALMMPDLGELLTWLMADADRARAEASHQRGLRIVQRSETIGAESERDAAQAKLADLRTWAEDALRTHADDPDVTSADAINREAGFGDAMRELLDHLDFEPAGDGALAKTNGGEWTKTYGWRFKDGSPGSVDGLPAPPSSPTGRLVTTDQDHWHGPVRDCPVEAVTDGGGTG